MHVRSVILAFALASCNGSDSATVPAPEPSDPVDSAEPTDPPTNDTASTPPTGDTGDTGPVVPQSLLQFTDGVVPTNLIIVSLDTTRRDHIGRLGGTDSTPNLDAVLAEAVVLEDHRSCSNWTAPSMTCVTTGLTPFELGWWPWSEDPNIPGYDDDLPTLAGQLNFLGWRTSVVTANSVFGPWLNLTRGFQVVLNPDWQPAEVVADVALREVNELLGQPDPFYFHVHFIDPHGDYCAPDEFLDPEYEYMGYDLCYEAYNLAWQYWYQGPVWQQVFLQNLEEIYDAELEYWDSEFGRFWAELDQMGALDDALVVFVTDHGEQLMERGGLGHGLVLGSEENRSTAAFWARNLEPLAWTNPTVHEDIGTTLQDLYGIVPPIPPTGVIVGLGPPDRVIRGINYWTGGPPELSIVHNGGQLLYDFSGNRAYFDLVADPAGLDDQYDPDDPAVIALWDDMLPWAIEVDAGWPHLGPPVDPGP